MYGKWLSCSLFTLGGTILADLRFISKSCKTIILNSSEIPPFIRQVLGLHLTLFRQAKLFSFSVKEISSSEEMLQDIASRKIEQPRDLLVNLAL